MKFRNCSSVFLANIILAGLTCFSLSIQAQEVPAILTDTTTKAPQTIKISEISIKSSQVVTQTNQTYDALIIDAEIERIGRLNDSIINQIDRMLNLEQKYNLESNSIRQFKNKLAY